MDEQTLRAWALEAGFAEARLCAAENFEQEKQVVAQQVPIAERKQLRFYPQEDWPKAQSLAVLLWPYAPSVLQGGGSLFVDSYYRASNAAYHAARQLEERILSSGCFAKANVSYPARKAAIRAKMGKTGKNGLLITPRYGTHVVIILMAVDINMPLKNNEQTSCEPKCLNCGRCVAACPTGAIDRQGMTHPERCLRNYMLEGIVVPEALREKMGMRLVGCDICQRVCPMQPHIVPDRTPAITLDSLITADEQAFSAAIAQLSQQIGRNAARPQRVRAQAALLSGNRKKPSDLLVLRVWADSPFEAVREHAKWAIMQIESAQRKPVYSQRTGLDPKDKTGYNENDRNIGEERHFAERTN